MEGALLQITNVSKGQQLLHYDAAAHAEAMSKPASAAVYGTSGLIEKVPAGHDAKPFDDVLAFISAAQEKCYQHFGQYMQVPGGGGGGGVDDEAGGAAVEDGENSVPLNSCEWSDGDEPAKKKKCR